MSFNINLREGQEYTDSLKIVNPADSDSPLHYEVSVLPYSVVGEGYTADLATETQRTQIAKWITIEDSEGEIQPNSSKDIEYTIKVPEGVPSGGQYAAIAVTAIPDSKAGAENSVSFNSVYELTSLIYANVNGKTTYGGRIIENDIPGFSSTPDVTVGAMVENTGNTHGNATIMLNVTDILRNEEIFSSDIDTDENVFSEVVMPETTRYITREINNLPSLGLVKIEQTIRFNGEVSEKENVVFIAPFWFIVLAALTAVVLLTAIITVVIKDIRHHGHKSKQSAKP